jgi:hypothetical protein
MELEGRVNLAIGWDGSRVVGAGVRARRPQVAARLLQGLPPGEAAARVPRVFSLCAQAQALASRLALLAAQGLTMPVEEGKRREAAVAAENVHEALWRMLRDWPEWLGEAADTKAMVAMRRALDPLLRGRGEALAAAPEVAAVCRRLLEDAVVGEALATWHARTENLSDWVARRSTPAARLVAAAAALPLAPLPRCLPAGRADEFARALAGRVDDEQFAGEPDWGGLPAETGVMQRAAVAPADGSVGARLLARIADAARAIEALAGAAPATPASVAVDSRGRGWALVDTSRGQLLHVAGVADGAVAFYRIVAPTEWNFHPHGALPGLIVGAPAASREEAGRLGTLAIQALDPCIAHRVEVVNA